MWKLVSEQCERPKFNFLFSWNLRLVFFSKSTSPLHRHKFHFRCVIFGIRAQRSHLHHLLFYFDFQWKSKKKKEDRNNFKISKTETLTKALPPPSRPGTGHHWTTPISSSLSVALVATVITRETSTSSPEVSQVRIELYENLPSLNRTYHPSQSSSEPSDPATILLKLNHSCRCHLSLYLMPTLTL